jgi:hypothetical protein
MYIRNIFLLFGCSAAAVGISSCIHLKADELQSGSEAVSPGAEECAAGCERIGGHLRVEFAPRIPDPSGFGRPGASPAAVRTDGGIQSHNRLRLPGGESGFDPFRR